MTYGRYGYRRIAALLRAAGWTVNARRVRRIWRRQGPTVPQRQPKRGRLWLNDGSCARLRAERPITSDPTTSSRIGPMTGRLRMLCVIDDEFTRETLADLLFRASERRQLHSQKPAQLASEVGPA